MRVGDQSQEVLQLTGSFSGYRPILELGQNYLSASASFRQPLCGNEEGWGPLSPFRYDFTPCFVDVWVFVVAVFGLVCGPLAVWYVLRKQKAVAVRKGWHFWTKQVSARMLGTSGPRALFLCLRRYRPIHANVAL